MTTVQPALVTNGIADYSVFPVADLDLVVSCEPHPLVISHGAEIRANWEAEVAANPALYDGRMVLQHRIEIALGSVRAVGHLVPFSTLLYWRKAKPPGGAAHLFAVPALMSSDNALIAIRMGEHTANPGKVYSPGGSLEGEDIVEGRCDPDRNMAREVVEETGIALSEAESVSGFHALHADGYVTLFRVYRFGQDAETLLARIAAHVAGEAEPEIAGAIAIRDADPVRYPYAHFMPAMLAWLFEGGQDSGRNA